MRAKTSRSNPSGTRTRVAPDARELVADISNETRAGTSQPHVLAGDSVSKPGYGAGTGGLLLDASAGRPVAFIVPAERKMELVLAGDKTRAVAIIIERFPGNIGVVEAALMMGRSGWIDAGWLARRWRVWAVFGELDWIGEQRAKVPARRPEGIPFAFL